MPPNQLPTFSQLHLACAHNKERGGATDAGRSQKALGIEIGLDLGVASTRINFHEEAVHLPHIDIAQRLADRVQVPLPYLLTDDDQLAEVILEFRRESYKDAEV